MPLEPKLQKFVDETRDTDVMVRKDDPVLSGFAFATRGKTLFAWTKLILSATDIKRIEAWGFQFEYAHAKMITKLGPDTVLKETGIYTVATFVRQ